MNTFKEMDCQRARPAKLTEKGEKTREKKFLKGSSRNRDLSLRYEDLLKI